MTMQSIVKKSMRLAGLFFLCFLTCFSSLAQTAEGKLTVVAAHWFDVTEPDGTGTYNELLKTVYSDTHQVSFDISTFIRSRRLFLSGKADVLVGVYDKDAHLGVLPVWHIDYEYPLVGLYDANKTSVNQISDISHLSVGWFEGYGLEELLPSPGSIYEFKEIEMGQTLLESGRIDVLIDYEYNFSEATLNRYQAIELTPRKKLWLLFQNTTRGKGLAEQFDQKMLELISNGILKDLYGKHYLHAEFDNQISKAISEKN